VTVAVTPQRLGSLLRPRSVALVGAADKSGFSRMAYRNLVEFGLGEHTHLVNRRGVTAHGRATVTSCTQIGEPVDLAFMMVPRAATLAALSDAAAAGIRNALVLSSGYADAGQPGQRAQADLVAHAESLGMLLAGPNHLGFANFVDQVPVTAIPGLPRTAGPVALVSQSGMAASAMLDFATMTGVGLSYLVTLGNEAMVAAGHVLDYLAGDPHTRAVALFLETIRDPAAFASAARRAAAAGQAVVVLKSGRSELSARAAAAHTGAAAGDDAAMDVFLQDLGVIRVEEIEDLILTAGAAAQLGRLARPGIGVVSISGGACDMLADYAVDLGAPLPALDPATRAALRGILPDYGTVQNPLDITGAAVIDPGIFTRCIEAVAADPSVGVVAAINALPWLTDGQPWVGQVLADAVGAAAARARVPVICASQVMQPITGYTRQVMAGARIPYAIPGLRHCVAALRNVGWWSEVTRNGAVPARLAGHGPVGESGSAS
jgi:acyl-CoA synthetase (NDP forming)